MKAKVLIDLLEQGKKPVVKLTDNLWDDSFGGPGMIARVVSVSNASDGMVELEFDYNENREHNVALDKLDWHLAKGGTGTAIEAGIIADPSNIHEGVYFELEQEVPAEFVDGETPLAEYLESGSDVPYVEWLEAKLEELVPNAMKTWKKGLD